MFRSNTQHKHLPEVKVEYGADGDILVSPPNPDTAEYFTCDINGCTFKAKTIKSLKGHKEAHKGGGHKVKVKQPGSPGPPPKRVLACKWCDWTTTSQQFQLTAHVNSAHLMYKPYKCDQCDFAGTSKNAVQFHVERKHSGRSFKHKCEECGYTAQG